MTKTQEDLVTENVQLVKDLKRAKKFNDNLKIEASKSKFYKGKFKNCEIQKNSAEDNAETLEIALNHVANKDGKFTNLDIEKLGMYKHGLRAEYVDDTGHKLSLDEFKLKFVCTHVAKPGDADAPACPTMNPSIKKYTDALDQDFNALKEFCITNHKGIPVENIYTKALVQHYDQCMAGLPEEMQQDVNGQLPQPEEVDQHG